MFHDHKYLSMLLSKCVHEHIYVFVQSVCYSHLILNKTNLPINFTKPTNIKYNNMLIGSQVVVCGKTTQQTDMVKLRGAFLQLHYEHS
jgi:hypothetical protein